MNNLDLDSINVEQYRAIVDTRAPDSPYRLRGQARVEWVEKHIQSITTSLNQTAFGFNCVNGVGVSKDVSAKIHRALMNELQRLLRERKLDDFKLWSVYNPIVAPAVAEYHVSLLYEHRYYPVLIRV